MADFYLKCRSVSEVMKFYLTQTAARPGGGLLPGIQEQADLFNLVGTFSLEFRSKLCEEWKCLLEKNRGTGVILLLGAGGVVFYLIRRRRNRRKSAIAAAAQKLSVTAGDNSSSLPDKRRFVGRYPKQRRPRGGAGSGLWGWLFEEELVEDLSRDSYWLRSHYFGPVSPIQGGVDYSQYSHRSPFLAQGGALTNRSRQDSDEFDVSLNSFCADTTPRKFLKAPLFDIRRHARTPSSSIGQSGRSSHRNLQMPSGSLAASSTAARCNPCPRCVKGTCRLKRHQMYNTSQDTSSGSSSVLSTSPINKFDTNKYMSMKTSTPDIGYYNNVEPTMANNNRCRLDGDGSDETEDPCLNLSEEIAKYGTPVSTNGVYSRQYYRPVHGMFTGNGKRGSPDGKERVSASPGPPQYSDSSSHSSSSLCPAGSTTTPERESGTRDEFSVESDMLHHDQEPGNTDTDSVTGSMLDLVHDAREIRRLIREVSIDSNASDLSLGGFCGLPHEFSAQSCHSIQGITRGLDELILNCANTYYENGDDLQSEYENNEKSAIVSSKSSTSGLYQYASTPLVGQGGDEDSEEGMLSRGEGSIPDLRETVQTTLKKSSKGLWKLTNITGLSDNGGGYSSRQASVLSDSGGSMEWDSPMHCGVLPGGPTDLTRHKYRYRTPVLSSNVSECSLDDLCSLTGSCLDQWEWDDAAYYITGEDEDERIVVDSTWLPDICSTELDLEAELKMRDSSLGPSCSARSSMEPQDHKHSSFSFTKQPPEQARLPPSGRSSADRLSMRRLSASSSSRASSCVSDDVTLRANGLNNSKVYLNQAYYPPSTTSYLFHRSRDSRSRSRERLATSATLLQHNNSLANSTTDLMDSSFDCSTSSDCHRPASSVDTSGISSMNSSMMSSTSSGSILVSSINLSPVKEALQEISSPHRSAVTSPCTPKHDLSMEISLGNIRTTDTVIKVQLPDHHSKYAESQTSRPGEAPEIKKAVAAASKTKAAVALFQEKSN